MLIPIVLPYHVEERNLASNLATNTIWTKSTFSSMILSEHFVPTCAPSAHLCCPVQVQGLQPTIESLQLLRKLSFLNNDTIINGLVEELPKYLAPSGGVQVQTEDDKEKW